MGREGLGEFEHLVLLAIARLGAEAYGVPIVDELEAQTGRRVSRASVYVALKRLEHKGFIASALGEPTPERGGRAKRYFQITALGQRRLQDARAALMKMWAGLPVLGKRS